MKKPDLTTVVDANGTNQLIRISATLILSHLIQIQNPRLSPIDCKMKATEELLAAVSQDWQV